MIRPLAVVVAAIGIAPFWSMTIGCDPSNPPRPPLAVDGGLRPPDGRVIGQWRGRINASDGLAYDVAADIAIDSTFHLYGIGVENGSMTWSGPSGQWTGITNVAGGPYGACAASRVVLNAVHLSYVAATDTLEVDAVAGIDACGTRTVTDMAGILTRAP